MSLFTCLLCSLQLCLGPSLITIIVCLLPINCPLLLKHPVSKSFTSIVLNKPSKDYLSERNVTRGDRCYPYNHDNSGVGGWSLKTITQAYRTSRDLSTLQRGKIKKIPRLAHALWWAGCNYTCLESKQSLRAHLRLTRWFQSIAQHPLEICQCPGETVWSASVEIVITTCRNCSVGFPSLSVCRNPPLSLFC